MARADVGSAAVEAHRRRVATLDRVVVIVGGEGRENQERIQERERQ